MSKQRKSREEAAVVLQKAYRKYNQRKLEEAYKNSKKNFRVEDRQNSNYKKHTTLRPRLENIFFSKMSLNRNRASENMFWPTRKKLLLASSLFNEAVESVLIFGGVDPHHDYGEGSNTGKDIFRYIPEKNAWEFVAEMPEPRHHHGTAFVKGKIYIVAAQLAISIQTLGADPSRNEQGTESYISDSAWSFDPIKRVWYNEAPLLEARKNFGLVAFGSEIFAIGGQGRNFMALKTVEKFDPDTNRWTKMAAMHTERTGSSSIKYKNSIWVMGGLYGTNKKVMILDSIESYDVRHNQWTKISHAMNFPRCFSSCIVMCDTLYAIGGAGKTPKNKKNTTSIASVDAWNDKKKCWQKITELSIPRHGHVVAYLGTQILVIGGVTTTYSRALSNVECFCSQRETWIRGVSCLPTPVSGHSVVTLPPSSLLHQEPMPILQAMGDSNIMYNFFL